MLMSQIHPGDSEKESASTVTPVNMLMSQLHPGDSEKESAST